MVSSIRKRDARIVPFDVNKIAQAIFRAASSQGGKDYVLSLKIAAEVLERLNEQFDVFKRLYDEMAEPKYVVAVGGCAISGGPFKKKIGRASCRERV